MQENVELSRAYLDGIARASQEGLDPEATATKLAEFWDPEIEWDMSEAPVFDIAGVYRGIEAGRQLWREWFSAWQTLQFDYELADAGDRVAWLIDLVMRGRSTGIDVPLGKHAFVTTFRDGLMVHSKLYMSQSEALEAVGLTVSDSVEENLALARGMYELWNAVGVEEWVERVCAPDIVFYEAPEVPDTDVFRGTDAFAAHCRELVEAAGHFQWKVLSLEGRGDHVLSSLEVSVEGHSSGAAVTTPFFHVARFGGGRLLEMRSYLDRDQARRDYERFSASSGRSPIAG